MIPLHQRIYSDVVDGTVLTAEAKKLDYMERVMLPMGGSYEQGFSNKCAAAGNWNVLETCESWLDEPLPTVTSIYGLARELAVQKKWSKGSFLPFVAEASCRLLDGAAKWMELPLPLDPQLMMNWLTVQRTGILLGMDWTAGHNVSRWFHNDILFPTAETIAPGHGFAVIGAERARAYREGFLWAKNATTPVFAIENTHQNTSRPYFIQAAEVPIRGRTAIVFVPPNY